MSASSRAPLLLFMLFVASGCGRKNDEAQTGAASASASGPATAAPATADAAAPGPAPTGPVDPALAEQGEKIFQSKGCIGCHTIGKGQLTGPDLKGVTERRAYGWFVPWVMNPDSMLKVDPTARQLLAQYMTPMLNMGVTRDDARALWEYLRHESN